MSTSWCQLGWHASARILTGLESAGPGLRLSPGDANLVPPDARLQRRSIGADHMENATHSSIAFGLLLLAPGVLSPWYADICAHVGRMMNERRGAHVLAREEPGHLSLASFGGAEISWPASVVVRPWGCRGIFRQLVANRLPGRIHSCRIPVPINLISYDTIDTGSLEWSDGRGQRQQAIIRTNGPVNGVPMAHTHSAGQ
ncbi:uncharacterized protein PG986_002192 [Apiospora aurea]|uniref:Uncharacterized protein n=1 Tax=Apiospora aurea TaxID=335848 RepID=A0ABR1QZ09_9PEZI